MQISDMLGQYNRNMTNGTEEMHGAQSVQKLVSTAGELSAGSIFEGTVNQVKGGKVLLALGNGQTIEARLDGKVNLSPGSSMFFQVKSNDGTTVAIRPYTESGNISNPILLNALSAAQVPATERTLAMVDAMMREQMPIGRQSVLDMAKLVNANPNANVQTIVQMTKLGLPVTEMMASQYEDYLSNRHVLLNEMNLAAGQVLETLGDGTMAPEDAFRLYGQLLEIFSSQETAGVPGQAGSMEGAGVPGQAGSMEGAGAPGQTGFQEGIGVPGQADFQEGIGALVHDGTVEGAGVPGGADFQEGIGALVYDGSVEGAGVPGQEGSMETAGVPGQAESGMTVGDKPGQSAANGAGGQGETLGNLLSGEQLSDLTKALQNIPSLLGNEEIFAGASAEEVYVDTLGDEMPDAAKLMTAESGTAQAEAVLNKDLTPEQFLNALYKALSEGSSYGFHGMQRLFAGKEFQQIFRNVIERQWLIKPQELKQERRISELYEKMERQISRMETAVKAAGITQSSFPQTAAEIRGNIEFMNQMNHIYNYVQIPLKMSGQSANGELYVYTNRKNLNDPDAELTAFLHLDMGNLGTTDVSVRMINRKVRTNFYLEDDASYDLVEKHLPILEKRLKNKGYDCSITITNEKKNVNFKENFVRRGHPSAGSLHRYSFDVRA